LYGDDPARLRAAGEEALAEIERIESRLSYYRPDSEISRINRRAGQTPARVSPPVFRLLRRARDLAQFTCGAFDITVAPLLRAWGFSSREGRIPDDGELAAALGNVGMDHLVFDENEGALGLDRSGVEIELGAIGKGYALDQAAEILRETGVSRALLHGGTSTVYALGGPPDSDAWKIGIPAPEQTGLQGPGNESGGESPRFLAVVPLCDEALSVSAGWGKWFEIDGTAYTHVVDPRNGRPVSEPRLTAVAGPSATDADALSTALLAGGPGLFDRIAEHPSCRRALFAAAPPESPNLVIHCRGIEARRE
jgi:FAD:protein FMN transferase